MTEWSGDVFPTFEQMVAGGMSEDDARLIAADAEFVRSNPPAPALPTLAEFLLARIAEDEKRARLATRGPWRAMSELDTADDVVPYRYEVGGDPVRLRWEGEGDTSIAEPLDRWDEDEDAGGYMPVVAVEDHTGGVAGPNHLANVEHVAAWNPSRVLAECEAKRRIVELYAEVARDEVMLWDQGMGAGSALDQVMRYLAQPYADRPDFRDEWTL